METRAQRRRLWYGLGAYILCDALCVGMGMGVPIFCILLGLPLGWLVVQRILPRDMPLARALGRVLAYAALAAAITLVGMALLWLPFARVLFIPGYDLVETGIPMILYEPRASTIGWVVLMVVISPFLQMLTALFGAHLALLWSHRRDGLPARP